MSMDDLRTVINNAMKNGGVLWVYYRNNEGHEREKLLKPIRWVFEDSTFVAHNVNESSRKELTYKVANILDWELFSSEHEALSYQPEETLGNFSTAPIPPRRPSKPADDQPKTYFSQVSKPEEWKALIQYYHECLSLENRKQYILEKNDLYDTKLDIEDALHILEGSNTLKYPREQQLRRDKISQFIRETKEKAQVLCLGYPFFVNGENKIIPLIYTPLTIEVDEDHYLLTPENLEVSYALLSNLKMTEEEIFDFLQECEQITPAPGETRAQALISFVCNKINEIYQIEIAKVSNQLQPGTIYDQPAFFRVSNFTATGNLIRELDELSNPQNWDKASTILKQLLTIVPEHDYPDAKPWEQDSSIHVTSVNQNQFRAIQAARTEPLVVVTGPPGTGKSQLVLNLIAEAILTGQKVLFASRNNQAVDVVMNRLIDDLKFLGAVRTGNRGNRVDAVAQMRKALNQVTISEKQDVKSIKQNYFSSKQTMLEAQAKLVKIRNLKGLLESYKAEREHYLGLLPPPVNQIAEQNIPSFSEIEFKSLVNFLSSVMDDILTIKEDKEDIEACLEMIEVNNKVAHPLIDEIHRIINQWGSFGGGFSETKHYPSVEALQSHLNTWINLIDLLKLKSQIQQISTEIQNLESELSDTKNSITEDLSGADKSLAERLDAGQLEVFFTQADSLVQYLRSYLQGDLSPFERFLEFVSFNRQLRKRKKELNSLATKLNIIRQDWIDAKVKADVLIRIAAQTKLVALSALLQHKLKKTRSEKEALSNSMVRIEESLPPLILTDINKFSTIVFDSSSLRESIHDLVNRTSELQKRLEQHLHFLRAKLIENGDHLKFLDELRTAQHRKAEYLWSIDISNHVDHISEFIQTWQNLLSFWKADMGFRDTTSQLDSLPTEDEAVRELYTKRDQMFALGASIIQSTWLERARQASNETIQKVNDYIAAVEALTSETLQKTEYQTQIEREKHNFSAAIQLFPIWGVTNLSARTNFPLESQLFDLVIIDEASQCDIPSALPLIFRGAKAVIIGDPNQLRHIATIEEKDDNSLATKHGVGLDAFSYKFHSLFDLAERNVGNHPGTLLLDEHYRSDARIINFSNQVYYYNRLKIKTDLTQRKIPKRFLDQFGGVYWINVEGYVQQEQRSYYNPSEISLIRQFIPCLIQWLKENNLQQLTIGIVTPYRVQRDHLNKMFSSDDELKNKITIGTAHQFQGDERDIMIFSPVVSQNTSEKSLSWLENNRNLLNVAVTRARVILFVVGDHNYCNSIEKGHCFHELANYVKRMDNRILESTAIQKWPENSPIDIIGYITDPHNPEHNRTTLRRFISSCSDYIWWIDRYFTDQVVDLFRDIFQDSTVGIKEVRLLTAKEQTQSDEINKPELRFKKYHLLRNELASKGINFEIRLMNRRDISHDRFLYTPDKAINMPPFSSAYGNHRSVSEYTQSHTEAKFFEEYWNQAIAFSG